MRPRTLALCGAVALHGVSGAMYVIWLGQPTGTAWIPQAAVMLGPFVYPVSTLLAGLGAVVAAVMAVVWRSQRHACVVVAVVGLLAVASGPLVVKYGWHLRNEWLRRIVAEASPLLAALSISGNQEQAPALVNAFSSRSLGSRRFRYERDDEGWQLSLVSPTGFGTTDRLLYRSVQSYPQHALLVDGRIDGWYERIGSWAYYHDNDE